MCTWLGLHQAHDPTTDSQGQTERLMFPCSRSHRGSNGLTEPLMCLPAGDIPRGSCSAVNGGQRWWHLQPPWYLEESPSPSLGGLSFLPSSVSPDCCLCLSRSFAAGASSLSLESHWICPAGQSRQNTAVLGLQQVAHEQRWAEKLNWLLM